MGTPEDITYEVRDTVIDGRRAVELHPSVQSESFFSKEKTKYLTGSRGGSVFYTRAEREILSTVSEAWSPYFEDSDGNERENDVGMSIIDNPFAMYTAKDLMQQFSKQRIRYGTVLFVFSRDNQHQLQIIDGSKIEEIKFADGVPSVATITTGTNQNIDIRLSGTVGDVDGARYGAVYIESNLLSGWSDTSFKPVDMTSKLNVLFNLESNLRIAMLAKTLNANQPSYAVIFDNDVPDTSIQEFKKSMQDQSASQIGFALAMKRADIRPLTNDDLSAEYMNALRDVQRQIFMHLGMPSELLEIGGGSVSALLYRSILTMFYKSSIDPNIDAFTRMWNTSIDGMLDVNPEGVKLAFRETMPVDLEQKIRNLRALLDGDVITINEFRADIGRDEAEEGEGADAHSFQHLGRTPGIPEM